jgi:hypothetical protein
MAGSSPAMTVYLSFIESILLRGDRNESATA